MIDPGTSVLLTLALNSALDWAANRIADSAVDQTVARITRRQTARKQLQTAFEDAEHFAQKNLSPPARKFLSEIRPEVLMPIATAVIELERDLDGTYLRAGITAAFRTADYLDKHTAVQEEVASAYYQAIITALAGSTNPVQLRAKDLVDQLRSREAIETASSRNDEAHVASLLARAESDLENGKNAAAQSLLDEAATRKPRSQLLRAQLAYCRGRIAHRRHVPHLAAASYLEAARLSPNDIRIRAGAVWAHELLGDKQRAQEVSDVLVRDFRAEPLAWARHIRHLSEATDFGTQVDAALRSGEHVELRVAIAEAARERRDFNSALDSLNAGLRIWPEDWRLWLMQADTLLAKAHDQRGSDSELDLEAPSAEVCREIELAATKADHLLRGREDSSGNQAVALLIRGIARYELGKEDQAAEDFLRANDLAPDNDEVRLRAGWALLRHQRVEDAIQVLDKPGAQSDGCTLSLAEALLARAKDGDLPRIVELLRPLAAKPEFPLQHQALFLALEALQRTQSPEGIRAFADDCAPYLPLATVLLVQALAFRSEGNTTRAVESALSAARTLTNTTPPGARRKLAALLSNLGEHKSALPIWKALFDHTNETDEARALVRCAMAVGNHKTVLGTVARWRQSNDSSEAPELVYTEVALLSRYAFDQALPVIEAFSRANPDNRVARMRALFTALHLGRRDVAVTYAHDLPMAQELSPVDGRSLSAALRDVGKWPEAVKFSYDLGRHHPDDADAQAAIRDVVLLHGDHDDTLLDPPALVDEFTAVRYSTEGRGDQNWYVMEPDSPRRSSGEVGPGSAPWSALLGRAVGETFVLSETFGERRMGRVEELKSKYLHRLHQTMEQHQAVFPDTADMLALKVPQREDGSHDVGSLLAFMERQNSRQLNLLKLHQETLVPAFALGGFSSRADGLLRLANLDGFGPRASIGSLEERHVATRSLESEKPIILDLTAALTVFWCECWELLDSPRLLVADATVRALRQWLDPEFNRFPKSAVLEKGPSWGTTPSGFLERFQAFVDRLKSKVAICYSLDLAAVDGSLRDWLDGSVGPDCSAALALAQARDGVFWTDDLAAGLIAKEKFATPYVWTQVVAQWSATTEVLSPEQGQRLTGSLLGWSYRFTSVTADDIVDAARRAAWAPERWPLQGALEYLGSPDVKPTDVAAFGVALLRGVATEVTVSDARRSFVRIALEAMQRHPVGRKIILGVQTHLRQNPGFAVVGEMDVLDTMSAWLAGSHTRVTLT